MRMLEHEQDLRLSSETQQQFAAVEVAGGEKSWMEVTAELQATVALRFGFGGVAAADDGLKCAVAQLRGAAPRYPELAFWVRHNRARRGDLTFGSLVPEVELAPLVPGQQKKLALRAQVPLDGRPLAVVALSYS
mmetsp:Transcript_58544/g.79818  ORF Transcript_58544/g.79818 Transcript_58544/m.79818 type:complete len:134 (+) Transcript_58544:846-1247(+)